MLFNVKRLTKHVKKELRGTRLLMTFMIYEQQFHKGEISSKYSSNCWAISAHE